MEEPHDNARPRDLFLECLERQRLLVQELSQAIAIAQDALISSDLKRLASSTRRLHVICDELRELLGRKQHPEEQNPQQAAPKPAGEASSSPEQREARLQAIEETAAPTLYSGRVLAASLRRARRTNRILLRLLASSAVTYEPPQFRAAAGEGGT
jgi:hypothetical protein